MKIYGEPSEQGGMTDGAIDQAIFGDRRRTAVGSQFLRERKKGKRIRRRHSSPSCGPRPSTLPPPPPALSRLLSVESADPGHDSRFTHKLQVQVQASGVSGLFPFTVRAGTHNLLDPTNRTFKLRLSCYCHFFADPPGHAPTSTQTYITPPAREATSRNLFLTDRLALTEGGFRR